MERVRRMSNSKLATYKRLSPNRTAPRRNKITGIVIHHMAGKLSVQQCGAVFASRKRQASSNYGVDSNGKIGLYVEEKNRAWTTGCSIDHSCVTIEVANDKTGGEWHVSDKAIQATIALCADICKRNGIKELVYAGPNPFVGKSKGNLYMHKWFQQTACPGPYLSSKFPYIAKEVNKILGASNDKKGKDGSTKKKEKALIPAESFDKKKKGTYRVTPRKGIVLRTGPSTKNGKSCIIPHNGEVECYGYYTKDWLYVSYKGAPGFVYGKYVKKL